MDSRIYLTSVGFCPWASEFIMKAIVKRPQSCIPVCRPIFIRCIVKVGDRKCNKLAIILIVSEESELYSGS